jgi:hypothetical protein
VTEVVAERVQFMSRIKGGRGGQGAPVAVAPFAEDAPSSGGSHDDDVPF